jgi:aspartate/methionine/tyrosine aminotransferase
MNPLAKELNSTLEGTIVGRTLSAQGRRMFFPKGIVAQSAEASTKATKYNATVGMAVSDKQPIMLASLQKLLPSLSSKEAVAYAPTGGVAQLRTLWENQLLEKNPSLVKGTFSLPMVIPGLTAGIFQAEELFLDPGDEVLIADMFWGNYRLIIEGRREAKVTTFPYFQGDGFNTQGFHDALQERANRLKKLMVILNFPNNPSGYTPTKTEAKAMVDSLVAAADSGLDLIVVCDDAYFGLFFEDACEKESIFAKLVTAHDRILAIKIDGSTKEDLVWGFRIGFMTFGSKNLSETHYHGVLQKLMGSIRSSVSSSPGIGQHLLVKTLESPSYANEKKAFMELMVKRYRKVQDVLMSPVALETRNLLVPLPFNSGYFMSFVCHSIGAEDLRLALLEKGIGTISIDNTFLRIAFSSVDEEHIEDLYKEIFTTAQTLHN